MFLATSPLPHRGLPDPPKKNEQDTLPCPLWRILPTCTNIFLNHVGETHYPHFYSGNDWGPGSVAMGMVSLGLSPWSSFMCPLMVTESPEGKCEGHRSVVLHLPSPWGCAWTTLCHPKWETVTLKAELFSKGRETRMRTSGFRDLWHNGTHIKGSRFVEILTKALGHKLQPVKSYSRDF